MPFDRYRERMNLARSEQVKAWLDKMRRSRATPGSRLRRLRPLRRRSVPGRDARDTATEPVRMLRPLHEAPFRNPAAAEAAAPVSVEAIPALSFDSSKRPALIGWAKPRTKLVRVVEAPRFHGKAIETLPAGEIRRAIEGQSNRQRRFPLDTANGFARTLRREGLYHLQNGRPGRSYVLCGQAQVSASPVRNLPLPLVR